MPPNLLSLSGTSPSPLGNLLTPPPDLLKPPPETQYLHSHLPPDKPGNSSTLPSARPHDPIYASTSHLSTPTPQRLPFGEPTSPKPPRAPQLLHKLWDLDLGNVEAIPYVELRTASPLLPPPLEDARRYPHFPGPPSRAYTLSGAHTFETVKSMPRASMLLLGIPKIYPLL
ncbi:hypothetical protein F5876DRAFT_82426 [Lentinula aff. lateritia]|uniref:Uncharacterized protein n=1 Tax=Lentinula aff. lateritia TaxID=2804960 RepID=A0ACC1TJP2_9AGAR|nr:hypothetical protein F5876DRAFT_82426 [Lentinula aff. lateritia]